MLRKLLILAVIAAVIGLFVFWGLTIPATVPASALPQRLPNLENGQTMFYAGGCASCHATPGQDDKTKLGGGFALKSPFGTFHAPNISPDRNDGIGKWSEADFVTAMVKGTSPDGSHLYPAFPYTSYQRMRYDDIRDLFAYIKTLPAVQGKAKPHELPFPFNIRRTLGVWKFLFLDGKPFRPTPARTPPGTAAPIWSTDPAIAPSAIRRAMSLAASSRASALPAGPEPTGDGFVPNITQKSLSLSQENLVKLLETGETPDGDTYRRRDGQGDSNTGKLGAADREAIATYVRSLPPVEGPKRPESK